MNLLSYIQGRRKGKKAHRIESEAIRDPFLADALDGYDSVAGDHAEAVKRMQRQVARSSQSDRHNIVFWMSVAASVLLIAGFAGYFMIRETSEIPVLSDFELVPPSSSDSLKRTEAIAMTENTKKRQQSEPVPPPALPPPPVKSDAESVVADESIPEVVVPMEEFELTEEVQNKDVRQLKQEEVAATSEHAAQKSRAAVVSRDTKQLKEAIAESEIIVSEPVIGKTAYEKYLEEKLIRPVDKCADAKGEVSVRFRINEKGRPYDLQVAKSLCEASDREAIRLISEGCDWTRGDDAEVTVTVKF